MDKKIKLVAIMGMSAAGKDTIIKETCARYKTLHKVVSTSTRPMREGEKDGEEYFFVDEHEFAEKVLNFEMLEATDFRDWFYGTEIRALDEDKINIGAYNPDGVRCLLEDSRIDLKVIWVQVPDKERLIRSLSREEHPDIEEIFRRYKTDVNDFCDLDFEFDIVHNGKHAFMSNVVGCVATSIIKHFG